MKPDSDGLKLSFRLWAKTDHNIGCWHALPYHLVDVGATASALWDGLSENSKRVAGDSVGGVEDARRCAIFFAAVHDVGKANRFFQQRDPAHIGRLSDLGVIKANEHHRHGEATAALLVPWLKMRWSWECREANGIAIAIGGHHGCFKQDLVCELLQLKSGYVPSVASALFQSLGDLYELPKVLPNPSNLNPFLAWLAGFVSVADWLGSHENMTIWCSEPGNLEQYHFHAVIRARNLLESLGWAKPTGGPALTIGNLVPEGYRPNDLQKVASKLACSDFGLAIIEAPTGEGKTEAAFALCEKGRAEGDGVFFALPTMATANGIYDRVNGYLQKATGEIDLDARLLHSQAWLYREDSNIVSNPGQDEFLDAAEDWFSGSKRGLLTPYGVGTIDQALVGSLRAKHGFVRLFALAGKTIVVDEVHAYDVYMSDLLQRLLGWLRALGCRVILLSATLPASRRQALIKAWGGTDSGDLAAYPCVTTVSSNLVTASRSIEVSPRKAIAFEMIPCEETKSWRTGADKVVNLVSRSGGFGVLILNTVGDAQAAYDYLKSSICLDIQIDLFHARFTLEDRKLREEEVLATYGKQGRRGESRILVATQVVEQSLDLDFDHMVSALAPIDLLIQRAGRLHRHKRSAAGMLLSGERTDERPSPVVYIIEPMLDERAVVEIEDRVYAHDVLMKTHNLLQSGLLICEPSDVSIAVNKVYDSASQESDRAAWQERYVNASEKAGVKRERHHDAAKSVLICEAGNALELITGKPTGFDENDDSPGSQAAARTRLEDLPSVNLVIIRAIDPWPPAFFSKEVKRSLALCTVRSPAYGSCFQELLDLKKPPHWDKSGVSKLAIPIQIDENGCFETTSYRFIYNTETGLTARRKNA